mmetsp:Transcript_106899/g.189321  ORF Transcript_106899/g.189321 Transcript_106899/m.189321 type:complete len:82 (+) Transcript_106899:278-523(+)
MTNILSSPESCSMKPKLPLSLANVPVPLPVARGDAAGDADTGAAEEAVLEDDVQADPVHAGPVRTTAASGCTFSARGRPVF